ncbi:MAG: hypothetical protein CVT48_04170 [Thermoplasmata archaeon HGW-Thermoplasmata-1]|nr:MAG: hypothetical protein CVT48_04170 [Thermoplasmata archaeon HGW-Thermoplasmata-1]
MNTKNLKAAAVLLPALMLAASFSGCIGEYLDPYADIEAVYTSGAYLVSYTIEYGNEISVSGASSYELTAYAGIPQNPDSQPFSDSAYAANNPDKKSTDLEISSSPRIKWEIEGSTDASYSFTVTVSSNGRAVAYDLGGSDVTIGELAAADPSIVNKYTKTQNLVDSSGTHPRIMSDDSGIRSIAEGIRDAVVDETGSAGAMDVAAALFRWLKQNTDYKLSSQGNAKQATETLSDRKGDCDDLTFLYISLLRSVSIPARFAVGYLVQGQNVAEAHAWAEVFVGGGLGRNGWISVECAGSSGLGAKDESYLQGELHQHFGVENPGYLRVFTDDGSDASISARRMGVSVKRTGGETETGAVLKISGYKVVEGRKLVVYKDGSRDYVDNDWSPKPKLFGLFSDA